MLSNSYALSKLKVTGLLRRYTDRLVRSQRIYLDEPAAGLVSHRDIEFDVKCQVSSFFSIPFRRVAFAGSAQLGFSVHKGRSFVEKESDLDVACISAELFQHAWMDIVESTQAFSNEANFSGLNRNEIDLFKDTILRRGMIRVELMPKSALAANWRAFESTLSAKYRDVFKKVSFAIYLNEYAFCWKQDSVLSKLVGVKQA